MKNFILIFTLFISNFIFNQNILLLKRELYKGKDVLKNAEILRDFYIDESPDSIYNLGIYLCTKAWEDDDLELLNYGKILIASQFSKKGRINEAKLLLKESEFYFFQNRNFYRLSDIYNQYGHCFYLTNDYKKAIKYYTKSLEAQSNLDIHDEMFMAHLGLSECFIQLEQYDNAEIEIQKFYNKAKKLNLIKAERKAQTIMGKIDFLKSNYDEGMKHYRKAFQLAIESGDKLSLSNTHNVIAIAFIEMNYLDSAFVHFNKSLEYRLQMNLPLSIIESYENLAEYFILKNKIIDAVKNFNSAIIIADKYKLTTQKLNIYNRLLELGNEYPQQIKNVIKIKDSVLILSKIRDIENLRNEKAIDSLSFELKKEDLILLYKNREDKLNSELNKKEQKDFYKIILLFIIIILLAFLFITYKKRKPEK